MKKEITIYALAAVLLAEAFGLYMAHRDIRAADRQMLKAGRSHARVGELQEDLRNAIARRDDFRQAALACEGWEDRLRGAVGTCEANAVAVGDDLDACRDHLAAHHVDVANLTAWLAARDDEVRHLRVKLDGLPSLRSLP